MLSPRPWPAPRRCISGCHRTPYFCNKINNDFEDDKRRRACALALATGNNDN